MSTDFKYVKGNLAVCDPQRSGLAEKSAQAELHEWGIKKLSTLFELENWYQNAHPAKPERVTIEIHPKHDLKSLFDALAEQWKSETWHVSSIRKTISHPAHMKIIGMGKDALQFIFDDMRKEKSLWFWALEAITRESILSNSTSMDELHDAWLRWASDHGY